MEGPAGEGATVQALTAAPVASRAFADLSTTGGSAAEQAIEKTGEAKPRIEEDFNR
jgi:hypothetical protein